MGVLVLPQCSGGLRRARPAAAFYNALILILELNIKDSRFDPFCLHFIKQKVKIIVKMNRVPSGNHQAAKYFSSMCGSN